MNKPLTLTLLALIILLLVYSTSGRVELSGTPLPDSPSIYNYYNGGVSLYFNDKSLKNGLSVIYSLDEITRYNPGNHVLFVIGPDKKITLSGRVKEWVSRGGLLVIMDETHNTLPLIKLFNMEYGKYHYLVVLGNCSINNKNYRVLFNVYQSINTSVVQNAKPVCRVRNETVAVYIKQGSGGVFVIGDSSLVINEIYVKHQNIENNTGFIDSIIDDRSIIVYEGDRNYTLGARFEAGRVITGLVSWISDTAGSALNGTMIEVAGKTSLLVLIATIGVILVYGPPSNPYGMLKGKGRSLEP